MTPGGNVTSKKTTQVNDSDQSVTFLGIRDIEDHNAEDGEFVEVEQSPSGRRDPEESHHDEAGRPVIIQGVQNE